MGVLFVTRDECRDRLEIEKEQVTTINIEVLPLEEKRIL